MSTLIRRVVVVAALAAVALAAPATLAQQPRVLKISHQFPASTGADGDFRDQLARKFAADVEKRTNGSLKVEVYPAMQLGGQPRDLVQQLDDALANAIKKRIRDNTTTRHVPAKVLQVADIPRTKSGKIVELAVREAVHGRAVKNLEALANPEALDGFRGRAELQAD